MRRSPSLETPKALPTHRQSHTGKPRPWWNDHGQGPGLGSLSHARDLCDPVLLVQLPVIQVPQDAQPRGRGPLHPGLSGRRRGALGRGAVLAGRGRGCGRVQADAPAADSEPVFTSYVPAGLPLEHRDGQPGVRKMVLPGPPTSRLRPSAQMSFPCFSSRPCSSQDQLGPSSSLQPAPALCFTPWELPGTLFSSLARWLSTCLGP